MDDKTSPSATENNLDTAKQKLGALAEKAKQHDFKGDARKAAEGVKDLRDSLKKHDFKTELKDAFAEARKSPASLWKKPETPRPGKELAVVGFAAAVGSFLITAVTSSSFLGLLCLLLGLGALLFSLLGLKTEGRKLAVGGTVVGLLVVFCSLGQMFGSYTDGEEDTEEITVASTTRKETLGNNGESKAAEEHPLGVADEGKEASSMDAKLEMAKTGKSKAAEEYPLLVPNEGEEASSVEAILEKAENARRIRSLNFRGFYTGMSCKNARRLCQHYGLDEDDFEFSFNHQSGEVFTMKFSTRAIGLILDVANNFETAELAVQECLGIVAWNNEREVDEGKWKSINQDEREKMWMGDAADVERMYETADGILVKMYPRVWNRPGETVFSIWDPRRGNAGKAVNKVFDHNSQVRKDRLAWGKKGIKTKILNLPRGYECLLVESTDDADCGCWIVGTPFSEKLRAEIFDEPETDKKESDVWKRMEASYKRGEAESKEAEKREKEWKEYEKETENLRASGKTKVEIRAMGYGLDHEIWIKVQNANKRVNSFNSLPAGSKGNLTFESKPTSDGKVFVIASTPEQIEARKEKVRKAVEEANRQAEEAKRREEEAKRRAEQEALAKLEKNKHILASCATNNNNFAKSVKQILDTAKIDNRRIELPHGVRMLVTRVDKPVNAWVCTFPINFTQFYAIELNSDSGIAESDWMRTFTTSSRYANKFVEDLNVAMKDTGWTFFIPDEDQWNYAIGELCYTNIVTLMPTSSFTTRREYLSETGLYREVNVPVVKTNVTRRLVGRSNASLQDRLDGKKLNECSLVPMGKTQASNDGKGADLAKQFELSMSKNKGLNYHGICPGKYADFEYVMNKGKKANSSEAFARSVSEHETKTVTPSGYANIRLFARWKSPQKKESGK